jgi:hypothetical protein
MFSSKNSLSNFDIVDIIHSQGVDDFHGVYMKDQLPNRLERGSYVINLQSSKDGNGTHWVCLYYTPNFSYYYDSYGFIAPLEVQKKIMPYMYNDLEIQDIDSTACGFYCVAFVLYLNKKMNIEKAFMEFINFFGKDTERNEAILYQILYK